MACSSEARLPIEVSVSGWRAPSTSRHTRSASSKSGRASSCSPMTCSSLAAALINGVEFDDVTADMRSNAKAINFGVIYGMGARALARQIGVSVREATAFIDGYFRTYPGVKDFIDNVRTKARETGVSTTLLGRRRPLPDILSDNNRLRSFSERIAVNTPIQGTAADLIKLAMLRVDAELQDRNLESFLLLQVHDELLLEVPAGELDAVTILVREAMEGVAELAVPLTVDIHTGANWADAHG